MEEAKLGNVIDGDFNTLTVDCCLPVWCVDKYSMTVTHIPSGLNVECKGKYVDKLRAHIMVKLQELIDGQ